MTTTVETGARTAEGQPSLAEAGGVSNGDRERLGRLVWLAMNAGWGDYDAMPDELREPYRRAAEAVVVGYRRMDAEGR
jgi:hypothetical protein